jgi:hypothetical protein
MSKSKKSSPSQSPSLRWKEEAAPSGQEEEAQV